MGYTTGIATTKANVEAKITALTGSELIDDLLILDKAANGLDCSNYSELELAIETLIDTQTPSTDTEDIMLANKLLDVTAFDSISGVIVNGTLPLASTDLHIVLQDGTEVLKTGTVKVDVSDEYPDANGLLYSIADSTGVVSPIIPTSSIALCFLNGYMYVLTSTTLTQYTLDGVATGLNVSITSSHGVTAYPRTLITDGAFLWLVGQSYAFKYTPELMEAPHAYNEYAISGTAYKDMCYHDGYFYGTDTGENVTQFDANFNTTGFSFSASANGQAYGIDFVEGYFVIKDVNKFNVYDIDGVYTGDSFDITGFSGQDGKIFYDKNSRTLYSFRTNGGYGYVHDVTRAVGWTTAEILGGFPVYVRIK